jgi:hypothetical protein
MAGQAKKDSERELNAAVRQLRDAHTTGKKILKAYPVSKTYDQQAMEKAAGEYKVVASVAARMRTFANRYNDVELRQLINLSRKYRRAFHFSYVVNFCTISDKRERAKLQRQAIIHGWTFNRIQMELRRRYGRRGQAVGRRPQIPSDMPSAIAELDRMCRAWRRWHAVLDEDQSKAKKPHVGLNDLPADVRRQLVKATGAIGRLEQVVAARLERSRITRRPRTRAG